MKRVEYLSSPARHPGVLVGNRGRDDTPRNCIRHDNLGSRPSKGTTLSILGLITVGVNPVGYTTPIATSCLLDLT